MIQQTSETASLFTIPWGVGLGKADKTLKSCQKYLRTIKELQRIHCCYTLGCCL